MSKSSWITLYYTIGAIVEYVYTVHCTYNSVYLPKHFISIIVVGTYIVLFYKLLK